MGIAEVIRPNILERLVIWSISGAISMYVCTFHKQTKLDQISCMLVVSYNWPTFMYVGFVLYQANFHVCELCLSYTWPTFMYVSCILYQANFMFVSCILYQAKFQVCGLCLIPGQLSCMWVVSYTWCWVSDQMWIADLPIKGLLPPESIF